jgi:hypothetical protein
VGSSKRISSYGVRLGSPVPSRRRRRRSREPSRSRRCAGTRRWRACQGGRSPRPRARADRRARGRCAWAPAVVPLAHAWVGRPSRPGLDRYPLERFLREDAVAFGDVVPGDPHTVRAGAYRQLRTSLGPILEHEEFTVGTLERCLHHMVVRGNVSGGLGRQLLQPHGYGAVARCEDDERARPRRQNAPRAPRLTAPTRRHRPRHQPRRGRTDLSRRRRRPPRSDCRRAPTGCNRLFPSIRSTGAGRVREPGQAARSPSHGPTESCRQTPQAGSHISRRQTCRNLRRFEVLARVWEPRSCSLVRPKILSR